MAWCRIGLARIKRQIQWQYTIYSNLIFLLLHNKDLIKAILSIYSGTSSSTFCQISDLKEAFEKINKHQIALKLEF